MQDIVKLPEIGSIKSLDITYFENNINFLRFLFEPDKILFGSIHLTTLLFILPTILIGIFTIYLLITNKKAVEKSYLRVWLELLSILLINATCNQGISIFLGIYFLIYDLVSCKIVCKILNIIVLTLIFLAMILYYRIMFGVAFELFYINAIFKDKDFSKAVQYHKFLIKLPITSKQLDIFDVKLAQGKAYYYDKKYEKSVKYFEKSFDKEDDFYEKIEALMYIAKAYKKLGDYGQSIKYAKKTIDYAIEHKSQQKYYTYAQMRNFELLFELSFNKNIKIEQKYIDEYSHIKAIINELREKNKKLIKSDI